METKSPCPPCTLTVRRNPPRRARPTPSSAVPTTLPRSPPRNISSFPIEDILSIEVPEKQLLTEHPSSSENLKVFLRVRPLVSQRDTAKIEKTAAEMKKTTKNAWPKNPKSTNALPKKLKKSNKVCLTVNDAHSVTLLPPQSLQDAKRIKSEVYEGFSHVFSSQASQREVYEEIVNPLVEDFLKGKSGMLAALGPSGSGKTHTIFGCGREPGMVPLALRQILSQEEGEKKKKSPRIFYLSMFEISSEKGKSEKIFDLSQDEADLCIQQSSIKGVREAVLYDAQQAESLIACGLLKRATAMTNSNSQSSRSQCIINIRYEYKRADGKVVDDSNSAVLTIVDLAGAEREKKTGNQGVRLLESNFINNTSMVFGLCLKSLLEHQKNPKKPMQKHFQNSLLTRYLRDYLEGKKRMALLLTVRSGEEDYLDTSFLLRQASPYTKIKFDIVEEHGILKHNKRPVQTTPIMGKLKRMKLSRIENCEINQRSDECPKGPKLPNEEAAVEGVKDDSLADVLVQSEETITVEANERNILRVDHVELQRKERNHQILQNFGKALWNVLKEYKRKLEVAENEICTLRDCLSSEKTRSAELENKLRDWQSNCCCRKGVSSEESSREEDGFRGKGSLDCEARQSTDQNEVDENETCTPRDCIITEKTRWAELENELIDWQSNCCCRKGVSSEVSFREVDELRTKSSLDLEDHQSIGCNEVTSEALAYSCHLEGSAHARNDERLDSTIAQQLESSVEHATGVEDLMKPNEMKAKITQLNGKATAVLSGSHSCTVQEYEQEEESSVRTSKATFINRDENDLLEEDRTLFNSVLPECSVSFSSSKSSLFVENNSPFQMWEDQTQNEEDKVKSDAHTRTEERLDFTTAQKLERSMEDITGVEVPKIPDGMKAESINLKGKENALLCGSTSCTDQEYEQEEESFGNSKILNLLFVFSSTCITIFLTLILLSTISTISVNILLRVTSSFMFSSSALITNLCYMCGYPVVCTSQATSINRDENDLLEEDHTLFDSVLPECTVNSSESSLLVENNSSFPVVEDQTQNEEDKTAKTLESSCEDATGVEDLKIPDGMKAESIDLNGKANALLSGSPSCLDQEYEREVSTSQATFINRDETSLLEEDHTIFDSVLSECTVNSSESSLFIENNRSFPVVEDQTENKEDKTAQQLESSIEDATGVEDLMKPNEMKAEITRLNGKANAVLSWSRSCTDQEDGQEMESPGNSKVLNPIGVEDLNPTGVEDPMKPNEMKTEISRLNGKATATSCTDQKDGQEMESFVCTSQATFINEDEASPFEEDHWLFDSVLSGCTVNSSESSVVVEYNNSFAVVENQTHSEEDKKPLGPSTMLMPKEVVHAIGCHDNNTPEAVTKHGSCTKFQNADRPKRRLLPVSSILLKDMGNIDFKDENEKPKGVKAEKKVVSPKNRTQGSTSLIRLLKDNLAI